MRLLIATPSKLLLYDVDTAELFLIEDHRPEYFGITWTGDGEHLVLSHSGIDHTQLSDISDYANTEKGWISCDARQSWPFLSMPHQISLAGPDFILASNTGRNALSRLRLEDMSVVQRRYTEPMWDLLSRKELIGNHFNSIFVQDDRVFFLAHNNNRDSFVLILSWPSLDVIEQLEVTGCFHMHNLWVTSNERLVSCNSHRGTIVDCRSREVLWDSGARCFTRGLACDGETLFVGSSELSPRDNRSATESGIWVVDPFTWKTRRYIHLGDCGNVQEIRLIDRPDLCHQPAVLKKVIQGTPIRMPSPGTSRVNVPAEKNLIDHKKWDVRQGTVYRDTRGRYKAKNGDLGVALRRAGRSSNGTLIAKVYFLRTMSDDYFAFVFCHQGGLDDAATALTVVFKRLEGDVAAVGFLRNDEEKWTVVKSAVLAAGRAAAKTPTDGEPPGIDVRIEVRADKVRIKIGQHTVMVHKLTPPPEPGFVGVRVLGDTVQASDIVWEDRSASGPSESGTVGLSVMAKARQRLSKIWSALR